MKKKLRILKILLKSSTIIILLFISCKNQCDEKTTKLLEDVRNDNYSEIKKILDNGGSATESCYDSIAGKFGGGVSILSKCIQLEKIELVKLILSYEINSDSIPKSEILKLALLKKDTLFIKNLIEKYDSKVYISGHNDNLNLDKIKLLKNAGYDFNYIDSYGNTLLIDIVNNTGIEENELLSVIKYLVEIGAKIDIKNYEGKTAYELAINEKVKEYLKISDKSCA